MILQFGQLMMVEFGHGTVSIEKMLSDIDMSRLGGGVVGIGCVDCGCVDCGCVGGGIG